MSKTRMLAGILITFALSGLALVSSARALEVGYTYDGLERLTSVSYGGEFRINYRYDPAGNLLLIWTGDSTPVEGQTPDLRFLSVSQPAPNPFNARVTISCEIQATQKLSVRVYDVRGRLVRTLVDEIIDAGRAQIIWNGRDDRGSMTASGLYFARVKTDHNSAIVRMVLVK